MKTIPGFPDYAITESGGIWSKVRKSLRGLESGRWLTNTTLSSGYVYAHLNVGAVQHHFRLSNLVLLTFVGPCPDGMECRHLDGNRSNNHLLNLKWGTHTENMQDAIQHGTHCCLRRGNESNRAILCENQVRLIFDAYHDGIATQQVLADIFGVSDAHISRIVNKKSWSHLWRN